MKKLLNITTTIVALFMATELSAQKPKEESKIATVVIASEIDCNHCKEKIEKNIAFEKGVKELFVSLENKTVTISYRKDKNSAEKLCEAINKLGYKSVIKQ